MEPFRVAGGSHALLSKNQKKSAAFSSGALCHQGALSVGASLARVPASRTLAILRCVGTAGLANRSGTFRLTRRGRLGFIFLLDRCFRRGCFGFFCRGCFRLFHRSSLWLFYRSSFGLFHRSSLRLFCRSCLRFFHRSSLRLFCGSRLGLFCRSRFGFFHRSSLGLFCRSRFRLFRRSSLGLFYRGRFRLGFVRKG